MENSKQVTVVGGSSFIGLHLVSQLLESGFRVNATTRTAKSTADNPLAFLQQKHPHALRIFEADVLDKASLAKAFEGSEAVFHLASPVLLQVSDAYKEQIQPTVDGTRNVFEACLGSDKVKTIIATSSTCTVHGRSSKSGHTYTEDDFYSPVLETEFPYVQAKIQAEKFIWDFMENSGPKFRIVIINPSFVFGPELLGEPQFTCLNSPRTNLGRSLLTNYLTGNWEKIPQGGVNAVDVRDVAQAHIRALENPTAEGRFIVTAAYSKWTSIIACLKGLAKNAHLPKAMEDVDSGFWGHATITNAKSISTLNMKYIPLTVTLKDFIDQLPEFQ